MSVTALISFILLLASSAQWDAYEYLYSCYLFIIQAVFYHNAITKLWLVPVLPERNLQFLTQNELVPELGKKL